MTNDIDVRSMVKRTSLGAHTLRYYERIGLIPGVKRATSGHRRYNEADVEWVNFLQCLRQSGMTIRQMLDFTSLDPTSDTPSVAVGDYLKRYREEVVNRIALQQEALSLINDKIKRYEILLETTKDKRNSI